MALESNWVTVVHWMVFPGPGCTRSVARGEAPGPYLLKTVDRVLRDPYFGGIELSRIKDRSLRHEVARRCAEAGKKVYYGAQPVQLANEERWIPPLGHRQCQRSGPSPGGGTPEALRGRGLRDGRGRPHPAQRA